MCIDASWGMGLLDAIFLLSLVATIGGPAAFAAQPRNTAASSAVYLAAQGLEPLRRQAEREEAPDRRTQLMLQGEAFQKAMIENQAAAQACGGQGGGEGGGGMPPMMPPSGGGDSGGGNERRSNPPPPPPAPPVIATPPPQQGHNMDSWVRQFSQNNDPQTRRLEEELARQRRDLDEQHRKNEERLAALDRQRVEEAQQEQARFLAALTEVRATPAAPSRADRTVAAVATTVAQPPVRERVTVADRLESASRHTGRGVTAGESAASGRGVATRRVAVLGATRVDDDGSDEIVDVRRVKRVRTRSGAPSVVPPRTSVVLSGEIVSREALRRARAATGAR